MNIKSVDLNPFNEFHIAVVIPAYRAEHTIKQVIDNLPDFVRTVVVVEDCSPDSTLNIIQEIMSKNDKIHLIRHEYNQGVGGAVLDGYLLATKLGATIVVKMDSDDQMDPHYLGALIKPIIEKKADYTKGNRFLHLIELKEMPFARRLGNIALSFLTKLSSGYWNIFDPTDGYTAIHASLIPMLNKNSIHHRFFFESSMLQELGLLNAVVNDIYIPARYGNEKSSLSEFESMITFPLFHLKGIFRRIIIQYYIKDFNLVSLFLITGIPLTLFGLIFGIYHWVISLRTGNPATTGTVMLATLPFILGVQLILQSLVIDIQNVPTAPIQENSGVLNQEGDFSNE